MSGLPGGDSAARALAGLIDPPQARVLKQIRALWRTDARQRHGARQAASVSGAQLAALQAIHGRPGLGVNALAAQLGVRQPTASNRVHGLRERGLVLRLSDGSDRRAVKLQASAAGQEVLAREPAPAPAARESALQRLGGRLLRELEQDLARLLSRLPHEGPGQPPGH